ncbi:hypothetical protein J6590_026747 [Homalodisca vitripennis]|nr:hypothetical protein J6590_026747 [Homalodisca vitripennis]
MSWIFPGPIFPMDQEGAVSNGELQELLPEDLADLLLSQELPPSEQILVLMHQTRFVSYTASLGTLNSTNTEGDRFSFRSLIGLLKALPSPLRILRLPALGAADKLRQVYDPNNLDGMSP